MTNAQKLIRVAIIDDHEIVREGIALRLSRHPEYEVCSSAENATVGLSDIRRVKPDVCVVDISMPGISGIEMIRQILNIVPHCRILVLTAHDETVFAQSAFRAGAHGYVNKQESGALIIDALSRICRGETYMSPKMQSIMVRAFILEDSARQTSASILTERESEVLQLIGQGLSIDEIGNNLHRSPKTIDVHRQHIKQKLNLKSNAELMKFAINWAERK